MSGALTKAVLGAMYWSVLPPLGLLLGEAPSPCCVASPQRLSLFSERGGLDRRGSRVGGCEEDEGSEREERRSLTVPSLGAWALERWFSTGGSFVPQGPLGNA